MSKDPPKPLPVRPRTTENRGKFIATNPSGIIAKNKKAILSKKQP